MMDYEEKVNAIIDNCSENQMNYNDLLKAELIKIREHRVCVFGGGNTGKYIFDSLVNENIAIEFICDNDNQKWGKALFGGVICLSLAELETYKNEVVVIVAVGASDIVEKQLKSKGFKNVYNYKRLEWLKLKVGFQKFIDMTNMALIKEKIHKLFNICEDEHSKIVCLQVIKNWFGNCASDIEYTDCQYFVNDIIKNDGNESFVDVGAFDGDTIKRFLSFCQCDFQQIHAFEIDEFNYKLLVEKIITMEPCVKNRIFLHNLGAWDCEKILPYASNTIASMISNTGKASAKVARLDNILRGENITFLKMDIEGAEQRALKGSAGLIRKYKPKLAVCIYHRFEDLWEIPFYIKALNPKYKIYIRHHSFDFYETVCYAIN